MKQSPAQRHKLRVLVEVQAKAAATHNAFGETQGTAYELQMAQLYEF
ncbi:MAG: hypothetical protein LBE30_04050 [Comamonas sp.]|jgi:hypothetical protein|nr:hypothetical protein [Comamonas sp.]